MQQYLKWCSKILWSKKYIQMYFILPGILITVLSPLYLYTCTKICFDVLILFCIWFYQKLRYTCIYLQYISRFVFIYSIYIYLGLIYLQYISRFGKHFKKTFLRVILLLFWTWPTVLPCLCNFSAFDLSHLTQLVLAFCVKSVDVHL